MTISFVGANSASATTVTVPTHQAGDLLLIYALRDQSGTAPSLPAGWTSLATNNSANDLAVRVGYKIAASSSETSGIWTNANKVAISVYRNTGSSPFGAIASNISTSSNTIPYPGITLNRTDNTSWVITLGATAQPILLPNPTGTTLRTRLNTGSPNCGILISDTAAPVSSWATVNTTVSGNDDAITYSIELIAGNIAVNLTGVSSTTVVGSITQISNVAFTPTSAVAQGRIGNVTVGGDNIFSVTGISTQVRVGTVFAESIVISDVSGIQSNVYLNYAAANIWTKIVTSGTV